MKTFNYYARKLLRIALDFVAHIIGLRFTREINYLPPITNPILLEPASELTRKIKSGEVSLIRARTF